MSTKYEKEIKQALKSKHIYVKCFVCDTSMLGVVKTDKPKRTICEACNNIIPFDNLQHRKIRR